MKIGKRTVSLFKIRNRQGYAAICAGCITEGRSKALAMDRMAKALKRVERKRKK